MLLPRHRFSTHFVLPLPGLLLAAGLLLFLPAPAPAFASAPVVAAFHAATDPLALVAVQQAELTASDGASDGRFGNSVAICGDTALVGAPGDPTAGATGAVYVFTRSGAIWTQQAELTPSDGAAGDGFGYAVALSGDTALIGAYYESAGGKGIMVGAAYVFTGSGASWTQQAEPTASDAAENDYFGYSVALSGDTALVGAPQFSAESSAGAAYVFFIGTPPTIDSFAPSSGLVGSLATLNGTNFTDASAVSFSGTSAIFTVSSDTQITATVPAGATSGPISVTTPAGTATSATGFMVTVRPTLTLKLSGLRWGKLKLGRSLTARGAVTPPSLAGSRVTLTVQRKAGGNWRRVKSLTATIAASGAYRCTYKPTKKGGYRIQTTIAPTAANTAAATA